MCIRDSDWTGARLRLRWEYAINANEEAIRLDPSIPSLAVGNPLPTGSQTGGDGFWTGAIDGGYALRIGGALNSAPQLLYNGASGRLAFRSTTGTEMIVLDVDGSAYFGGPMTIASGGGIWQGTGSFASPTTGLKIYNSSGVGRLSTYNAGLEQITINTAGELATGDGRVVLDRNGLEMTVQNSPTYNPMLRFLNPSGVEYGNLGGLFTTGYAGLLFGTRNSSRSAQLEFVQDSASEEISLATTGEANRIVISSGGSVNVVASASIGLFAPTRISSGLVIGDTTITPLTAVLVMKERTAATSTTPTDTAQIWVQDVAGVQKLYIKFANGAQRELATS